MKQMLLLSLATLFAASLYAADSESGIVIKKAAQQLGEKPNFSWTSTPRSEAGSVNWRQGPTEGQSEKGGYSFISFTYNDNPVECAFNGSKEAIKIDSVWTSADELTGDREWIAGRLRAFKAPPDEAAQLATHVKEFRKGEAGLYSGDLTEEGVKSLLSAMARGGQAPVAKEAKGSVKFWLKDGALIKYEYNLQGKIARKGAEEMDINRTTTVEIKDVGATKVQVPDEAKKKLA